MKKVDKHSAFYFVASTSVLLLQALSPSRDVRLQVAGSCYATRSGVQVRVRGIRTIGEHRTQNGRTAGQATPEGKRGVQVSKRSGREATAPRPGSGGWREVTSRARYPPGRYSLPRRAIIAL